MPQRYSGVKDLRKNRKQRLRNLDIKTDLRKTIKKFISNVEAKNTSEAQSDLKIVYKKIG